MGCSAPTAVLLLGVLSPKFHHDVSFDDGRKRPVHADIVFVDEDGDNFVVTADAVHPNVNANYGAGHSRRQVGDGLSYYKWDSNDPADLDEVESSVVSLDQLMEFQMDGMTGHGIFELLVYGDRYPRYPNWGVAPLDGPSNRRGATAL